MLETPINHGEGCQTIMMTYHSHPSLGENLKVWDALDFLALATSFIPRAAAVTASARRREPRRKACALSASRPKSAC